MNPFYGGPNGQSFYIKAIFTSKNGISNSIKHDLSLGWTSPISENEFVVISYGMPSDENYDIYKQIDLDAEQKSFNSTLWQKCYDETKGNASGWYYKLISAMTGNTPKFHLNQPIQVLDADEDPKAWMDISDPDLPILFFALPQSQILSMKEPINILNANEKPTVKFDDTEDINRPTLEFSLPQSQVIEQALVEEVLDVGEQPEVRLDISEDGTINRPILKLKLPLTQEFLKENILHEAINANILPYITFDNTNKNNPILKFWLPQAQVMQDPGLTVVGPSAQPEVDLDSSDINKPKLDFKLPRAVKFYYGDLLGERQNSPYTISNPAFVNYGVGDYYINAKTGFIYYVSAVNGNEATFDFVACIQSPLPEIGTVGISPYKADKTQNDPVVNRSFTNNELTAWKLEFRLPKAPIPDIDYEFIGPLEDGSASVEVTDEDTITFGFKIPTGSRMFAGLLVDTGKYDAIVPDARPGDLYLNADTGVVYILQKSGIWEVQQGSLKGPVGDALHIVREYTITGEDTFSAGKDYILNNYKDSSGNPLPLSPDEIFAVTFDDVVADKKTSYWYFYTEDGQWGRVQLTGGVMNLIENTYQESTEANPVTNKTYSIDYINKLIGGKIDKENWDKTAFSKDQIYDLLSWGTWADAIAGDDIPIPENHDTLSAEEVVELMSWGSIAKLAT